MTALLYVSVASLLTISNAVLVNTTHGRVEGEVIDGINTFIGIPFAKPPIGDLRFASPQSADAWTDTLTLNSSLSVNCVQDAFGESGVEDCLYVNIYAPSDAEYGVTSLPVMLWIYGGAFFSGSASLFVYDGAPMVDAVGDIIIVAINYRLGLLGFLYDNTFGTGVLGNFGFEDQMLAIDWVSQNIAFFGGDPNSVTLFGESAGATSVALHLLYNNENISSGIMQSPPMSAALRDPVSWAAVPSSFSELIGCDTETADAAALLQCWRHNATAEDILSAQNDDSIFSAPNNTGYVFSPTVGTALIPEQPLNGLLADDASTPPFMIGTNSAESFGFVDGTHIGDAALDNFAVLYFSVQALYGSDSLTSRILDFYGSTAESPATSSYVIDLANVFNDAWICSVRRILATQTATESAWYYNFDFVDSSFNRFVVEEPELCWTRACHFSEVFYLFLVDEYAPFMANDSRAVGEEMQALWSDFAKNGEPGNEWPQYVQDDGVENFVVLGGEDGALLSAAATSDDRVELCAFWDSVGYLAPFMEVTEPTNGPTMVGEGDGALGRGTAMWIIGAAVAVSTLMLA